MKTFKTLTIVLGVCLVAALFVTSLYGAFMGSVFGLFSWEVVLNFFEGFTAEQLIGAIAIGLAALVPQLVPTLLNWLKSVVGLEDKSAHWFVLAVIFMLSGILLLTTGTLQIAGLEFTLANLMWFIGEVYLLTQISYKQFLQE